MIYGLDTYPLPGLEKDPEDIQILFSMARRSSEANVEDIRIMVSVLRKALKNPRRHFLVARSLRNLGLHAKEAVPELAQAVLKGSSSALYVLSDLGPEAAEAVLRFTPFRTSIRVGTAMAPEEPPLATAHAAA